MRLSELVPCADIERVRGDQPFRGPACEIVAAHPERVTIESLERSERPGNPLRLFAPTLENTVGITLRVPAFERRVPERECPGQSLLGSLERSAAILQPFLGLECPGELEPCFQPVGR